MASPGLMEENSFPSITMLPSSNCIAPETDLIRVDFPAPFSPISACISPFSNEQETLDINKENMDDCIVLCGAVLMIRGWMYLSDREKKQKEEETCERISSKKYVKKIEKNGGSYERI